MKQTLKLAAMAIAVAVGLAGCTKVFTVTVNSNNDDWGTVEGGGEYENGATATLTATAAEGYEFVQWNDGNTDNPRQVTVTADVTYTATFAEKEEEIQYTESGSFGFVYNGRPLAAGGWIQYHPTQSELENDWATPSFCFHNRSGVTQQAMILVEKMMGPDAFDHLSICFGELCRSGVCPWTGEVPDLHPGLNDDLPVTIDYSPSAATSRTVYRITVGKGAEMADPQVVHLELFSE